MQVWSVGITVRVHPGDNVALLVLVRFRTYYHASSGAYCAQLRFLDPLVYPHNLQLCKMRLFKPLEALRTESYQTFNPKLHDDSNQQLVDHGKLTRFPSHLYGSALTSQPSTI
jgi:hypothetical protein